jgi:hypothetical protein
MLAKEQKVLQLFRYLLQFSISVELSFALFAFELVQRHYTCGGVSAKPEVFGIKCYKQPWNV